MRNDFFKHLLLSGSSQAYKKELENETLPFAFTSNGHRLRNYRIYGNASGVGDLDDGTGKYVIPIKIEGKNVAPVSGVPSTLRGVAWSYRADGAVTGTRTSASENLSDFTYAQFTLSAGSYIFTRFDSESTNAGGSTYQANIIIDGVSHWGIGAYPFTINDTAATIKIILRVYSAFDGTAIFKPMIRIATISNADFEPYHEPETCDIFLDEPLGADEYIDFREQKNDDGDIVFMPALISVNGTNVLSVGTTVQPAKVYVQGNIQEIPVSLQMSPLNLQNLQTMMIDDSDFSPDIMPIDTPNLRLNDFGGADNAK